MAVVTPRDFNFETTATANWLLNQQIKYNVGARRVAVVDFVKLELSGV